MNAVDYKNILLSENLNEGALSISPLAQSLAHTPETDLRRRREVKCHSLGFVAIHLKLLNDGAKRLPQLVIIHSTLDIPYWTYNYDSTTSTTARA
jgi:hypothetical protein